MGDIRNDNFLAGVVNYIRAEIRTRAEKEVSKIAAQVIMETMKKISVNYEEDARLARLNMVFSISDKDKSTYAYRT